ncbi:hypothetical protein QA634_14660 [Methylobacterium sp. CB376]|uniref:hypothetical protein n=1 Tax=unclassified Methylobacterium TaxID=2615210 RepID=UPI0012378C4A|nr:MULTISPECIES: hypothetical protein [Methylobacterium]WFT82994.1 hypothetical protein QA634_14660 [Methylobacterium nodulans]
MQAQLRGKISDSSELRLDELDAASGGETKMVTDFQFKVFGVDIFGGHYESGGKTTGTYSGYCVGSSCTATSNFTRPS